MEPREVFVALGARARTGALSWVAWSIEWMLLVGCAETVMKARVRAKAELNNQQSLQGTAEPVAIEQVSQAPVASAKRRSWWFKGRHDDAGPGSIEPGDPLG